MKSKRQEYLSQDARDLLAYAFELGLPVGGLMPICGAEVKIGENDVQSILYGGDKFHAHGGVDSEHYFTHRDDPEWAVVIASDCDGSPERGEKLLLQNR